MIRTLLVDMPFSSAYRPNLALETLQACLKLHSQPCDLNYAKLEFAAQIGLDLYTRIAEAVPTQFLLGDFIFGELLEDASYTENSPECYYSLLQERYPGRVPCWLRNELGPLRAEASEFQERIARMILETEPRYDLIGFNLSFQMAPSLSLSRLLKQAQDPPQIVVGGSYCEGEPGVVIHQSFTWIDYVARGEGEKLIVDLVNSLSAESENSDLSAIKGLIWRRDNCSVVNGETAEGPKSLDDVPLADYRSWLGQLDRSGLYDSVQDTVITYESSRGCWYGMKAHCIFCGLNGASLRFRSKSPQRILQDIEAIEALGVENIEAVDLIMDMAFFKNVLPQLEKRSNKLSLFYETKANLSREQLRLLSNAGVKCIQPGIESFSGSLLDLMRKGVAPYQNIRLLKWCMEFGIKVQWNLLFGFPSEDREEYQRMAELIPFLVHLQPPMEGCTRVLVNRFSPLFEEHKKWGVETISPVPAYERIFGGFVSEPGDVAYFFDFEQDDPNVTSDHYINRLEESTDEWHSLAGKAVFLVIDQGDYLEFVDTRPVTAATSSRLEGRNKLIHQACEQGASIKRLVRETGLSSVDLLDSLSILIGAGYIVELEGRYLSLAVCCDEWLPQETPESIRGALCQVIAKSRSSALSGCGL